MLLYLNYLLDRLMLIPTAHLIPSTQSAQYGPSAPNIIDLKMEDRAWDTQSARLCRKRCVSLRSRLASIRSVSEKYRVHIAPLSYIRCPMQVMGRPVLEMILC